MDIKEYVLVSSTTINEISHISLSSLSSFSMPVTNISNSLTSLSTLSSSNTVLAIPHLQPLSSISPSSFKDYDKHYQTSTITPIIASFNFLNFSSDFQNNNIQSQVLDKKKLSSSYPCIISDLNIHKNIFSFANNINTILKPSLFGQILCANYLDNEIEEENNIIHDTYLKILSEVTVFPTNNMPLLFFNQKGQPKAFTFDTASPDDIVKNARMNRKLKISL